MPEIFSDLTLWVTHEREGVNFSSLSHRRGRINISRKSKSVEIVLAESSNRKLDFNFISNTGYENCGIRVYSRQLHFLFLVFFFFFFLLLLSPTLGLFNRELWERMRIIRGLVKPSRMLPKNFFTLFPIFEAGTWLEIFSSPSSLEEVKYCLYGPHLNTPWLSFSPQTSSLPLFFKVSVLLAMISPFLIPHTMCSYAPLLGAETEFVEFRWN